jgi:hypothetical protein
MRRLILLVAFTAFVGAAIPRPAYAFNRDLYIYRAITLSDAAPVAGSTISASVQIANRSGHTVHAPKIGIGGRGPAGWDDIQDCAPFFDATLPAGYYVETSCTLVVRDVGRYILFAVWQDDSGAWIEVMTYSGASQKAYVSVRPGRDQLPNEPPKANGPTTQLPQPPPATPPPAANAPSHHAAWVRMLEQKYQALGGAPSWLGPPRSPVLDATPGPSGTRGVYQVYAYGVIHSSDAGAFESHGDILGRYSSMGGSGSWLGFPISDEIVGTTPGTRRSVFEHGYIGWAGSSYEAFRPPLPEAEVRWAGDGYVSIAPHCDPGVCRALLDSAAAQALANRFDELAQRSFDLVDLGQQAHDASVALGLAPAVLQVVLFGVVGVPAFSIMAAQLRAADHGSGVQLVGIGAVCCVVQSQ